MLFSSSRLSDLSILVLIMSWISPGIADDKEKRPMSKFCNGTSLNMNDCTLTANCGKTDSKTETRRRSSLNLNHCFAIVEKKSGTSTSNHDFVYRDSENQNFRVV